MKRLIRLTVLSITLIGTAWVSSPQPCDAYGCRTTCFYRGTSCGQDCICLCRQSRCRCFAEYRVGDMLEEGWSR